ncbi:MAG: hypothetical protein GF411_18950 [Candidatus Lokiarchaeota archaeon]|nr:hypothetical protein [Candidatus Lokiarchaeota archaeon]
MVKQFLLLISLIIIFPITFLCGCISENSETENPTLCLTIDNNDNSNLSIEVIIKNSDKIEIYNNTLELSPNEYFSINDITKINGVYSIKVIHNNSTFINNDIRVEEKYSNVKIQINNNDVEISQIVK